MYSPVSVAARGDLVDSSLLSMTSTPTPYRPAHPPSPEHANTSPSPVHQDDSSGSASYASTTSSFLAAYFPQRYFILKSLTLVSPSFFRPVASLIDILGRITAKRGKGTLGHAAPQRGNFGSSLSHEQGSVSYFWRK